MSDRSHINQVPRKVIFWGGGGLARTLKLQVEALGGEVVAIFNDIEGIAPPCPGVPVLFGKPAFDAWIRNEDPRDVGFLIAIGNPHGRRRLDLHEMLLEAGLQAITIVHPTAWIAADAEIGVGSQVDACAVIMANARLGRQCLVGPNCTISHDDVLEDGVDVTVGVTICGEVHVGKHAWLGGGCVIRPRVRIGDDAIVGLGAVVTKDVAPRTTVVGNPARPFVKAGA